MDVRMSRRLTGPPQLRMIGSVSVSSRDQLLFLDKTFRAVSLEDDCDGEEQQQKQQSGVIREDTKVNRRRERGASAKLVAPLNLQLQQQQNEQQQAKANNNSSTTTATFNANKHLINASAASTTTTIGVSKSVPSITRVNWVAPTTTNWAEEEKRRLFSPLQIRAKNGPKTIDGCYKQAVQHTTFENVMLLIVALAKSSQAASNSNSSTSHHMHALHLLKKKQKPANAMKFSKEEQTHLHSFFKLAATLRASEVGWSALFHSYYQSIGAQEAEQVFNSKTISTIADYLQRFFNSFHHGSNSTLPNSIVGSIIAFYDFIISNKLDWFSILIGKVACKDVVMKCIELNEEELEFFSLAPSLPQLQVSKTKLVANSTRSVEASTKSSTYHHCHKDTYRQLIAAALEDNAEESQKHIRRYVNFLRGATRQYRGEIVLVRLLPDWPQHSRILGKLQLANIFPLSKHLAADYQNSNNKSNSISSFTSSNTQDEEEEEAADFYRQGQAIYVFGRVAFASCPCTLDVILQPNVVEKDGTFTIDNSHIIPLSSEMRDVIKSSKVAELHNLVYTFSDELEYFLRQYAISKLEHVNVSRGAPTGKYSALKKAGSSSFSLLDYDAFNRAYKCSQLDIKEPACQKILTEIRALKAKQKAYFKQHLLTHNIATREQYCKWKAIDCEMLLKIEINKRKKHLSDCLAQIHQQQQELLSGTRKNHLTTWWLSLIRSEMTNFLAKLGYNGSAIEDDYIDTPPKDIRIVQKNLLIVNRIMRSISTTDPFHFVDFIEKLKSIIYPRIQVFLTDCKIALKEKFVEIEQFRQQTSLLCAEVRSNKSKNTDANNNDNNSSNTATSNNSANCTTATSTTTTASNTDDNSTTATSNNHTNRSNTNANNTTSNISVTNSTAFLPSSAPPPISSACEESNQQNEKLTLFEQLEAMQIALANAYSQQHVDVLKSIYEHFITNLQHLPPSKHFKETMNWIDNTIQDMQYLVIMKQMEDADYNEEADFNIVPISGLIINVLARKQNIYKTVLSIWIPQLYAAVGESSKPRLHKAVEQADELLVECLANTDDVNFIDCNGWSCLHYASSSVTRFGVLSILLTSSKINSIIQNKFGDIPLHYFARLHIPADKQNTYTELLQKLINNNSDAVFVANDLHETPLHSACLSSNLIAMKFLLAAGADPNATTRVSDEETCLHYCARAKHLEGITLLMEYGCDMEIKNIDNLSALDVAIINGDVGVWRHLQSFTRV